MKIDKCCGTCEFNFGDVCASHGSGNGYGWNIDDYEVQRECWEISLDYSIELTDKLPEDEKNDCLYGHKHSISDLVRRIETGIW